MEKNEFLHVFNDGFHVNVEGDTSEIPCFLCELNTKLNYQTAGRWINKKTTWFVECENKHAYDLIEYTKMYADLRDGIFKKYFDEQKCNF